ncbi:MAG: hypothetical protein WED05_10015 [Candidatus Atabeyarchaeum deiterrae]
MDKRLALLLVALVSFGVVVTGMGVLTPAQALDPTFSCTATPNKAMYVYGESATVAITLTYNYVAAAKYLNIRPYLNDVVQSTSWGQFKVVAGSAGYTNSSTKTMPVNATKFFGTRTYVLKFIENTTNFVIASVSFVITVSSAGYTLSVGMVYTDSDGDKVLDANEPIQYTAYLTYSYLNVSKSVAWAISIDGGAYLTFDNDTIVGSNTINSLYSNTFSVDGKHAVDFKVYDSLGVSLATQHLDVVVGGVAAGSWIDYLVENPLLIVAIVGVVLVVLVAAIALRRPKGSSSRRFGRWRRKYRG